MLLCHHLVVLLSLSHVLHYARRPVVPCLNFLRGSDFLDSEGCSMHDCAAMLDLSCNNSIWACSKLDLLSCDWVASPDFLDSEGCSMQDFRAECEEAIEDRCCALFEEHKYHW